MKIFTYELKKIIDASANYLERCRQEVLNQTKSPKPWNEKQNEVFVETTIPEKGFFHANFVEYLEFAYANHHSIVVSPHVVWYTILSELATYINNNIEECRSLFTRSIEKIEILVDTGGDYHMPLPEFMNRLERLVPIDTGLFVKEFSTSTANSKLASMAAFCEAVSPYYNYSLYCCGYNRIKIDGTCEDWESIVNSLARLSELMPAKCLSYLNKAKSAVESLISWVENDNAQQIYKILYAVECGSGSQTNIYGWIHNLLMDTKPTRSCNFPSHIAKVPYEVKDSWKYNLCYGLFASDLDADGFLVPDFYQVINRIER